MSLGLTPLPMAIQTLLSPSQVESQRLEFKATWDDRIKDAVIESACAFANDLLNLNGGYIVLGLEQDAQGRPVLPPRGVDGLDLDRVMKEVFGACKQLSPDYQPIPFLETYQDRQLLILFCPGGDNRPYQAPNYRRAGQKAYFVRQGPLTTIAQADTLRQLMEQASKIPWDDRRCLEARFLDVSPTLVRRHLHQAGSHLAEEPLPDAELYRKLRLTVPVNAHTEPRNVALLFFQDDPTRFFPGARIELCEFPEGRGGDRLIEHTFSGPLPEQLRACQNYFEGMLGNITQKPAAGLEAQRIIPYPARALQEALVNAVYHRSYESSEPTKVYIEPDSILITSYPGPHAAIRPEHFRPGNTVPEVPARNRRIGELLKELRIAEARGSGILKIQRALADNGSPPAEIDCDPTFFSVRIPIYGASAAVKAMSLASAGHEPAALETAKRAWAREPSSRSLVSFVIGFATERNDRATAKAVLDQYLAAAETGVSAYPVLQYVESVVMGRPGHLFSHPLTSRPLGALQREVLSYLSKIQVFDFLGLDQKVAYWMWCAREMGEALTLLAKQYGDKSPPDDPDDQHVLNYETLLAGLRLDLAAEVAEEIAEQLLLETENRLEELIKARQVLVSEKRLGKNDSGRLYLRLAQVRQRLGRSARAVRAAVRLAHQYAERAQDKEALTLLEQVFPTSGPTSRRG